MDHLLTYLIKFCIVKSIFKSLWYCEQGFNKKYRIKEICKITTIKLMSKNSAAIIKSTREQINCKQPYYQTILVRFHLVPSCIPAQNRKKRSTQRRTF